MYNTAVGQDAGNDITTGINNTIIGALAGDAMVGAQENTVLGVHAGGAVTEGDSNVFIGYNSGVHAQATITGGTNTIVGAYAHTTADDSASANGFGYNIAAIAGYTTVGAGNDDIRAPHGNVTWSTISDERVKKDITDSTAGLSFINDLRPRTFKYKNKGDLPEEFSGYEEGSTEVYKNSNIHHGFIAQEVKAAIDSHSEITDGFKMWNVRETGAQEVGEAAVIPILVKAIQELSAKNDALEARLTTLEG
tara:strand:- start:140 stop:889 length:750 start_codon:yes stop_codon:yes gene_type:complete